MHSKIKHVSSLRSDLQTLLQESESLLMKRFKDQERSMAGYTDRIDKLESEMQVTLAKLDTQKSELNDTIKSNQNQLADVAEKNLEQLLDLTERSKKEFLEILGKEIKRIQTRDKEANEKRMVTKK